MSLGDGFNYQAVDCFSLGCEGGFIYSSVSFIHRLPGVKTFYCFCMKEGLFFLLHYLCCITLINFLHFFCCAFRSAHEFLLDRLV